MSSRESRIRVYLCRAESNLIFYAVFVLDSLYDLGLSIKVIENISSVSHFTRIKEALKTTIQLKRNLNLLEEQKKARLEEDTRKAREANRSLSHNERAEGYICPVCYFALTSQDELISHWQNEHSLNKCENDVFQEVDAPLPSDDFVLNNLNDMTIIEIPKLSHVSESEDVVASFTEQEITRVSVTTESSASTGSDEATNFETQEKVSETEDKEQ